MREPAARPVLALLTDFGTRDPYVGAMKGAALSVCGDATLVDLTHDIAAHDVVAAARHLAAAAPYFPPGTAFVVIVDPGVGSARRALAARAGGCWFVGPDNWVLTPVLTVDAAVVEITSPRYMRDAVSRTFEGRDRFAPAAAWLAKGVDLGALGRPAGGLQRLAIARPEIGAASLDGEVLRVDRFGNLITNIDRRTFEKFAAGGALSIGIGDRQVSRVVSTYADAGSGELTALFGSSDHLELAVNGASAAAELAAGRGARVRVARSA
jgi:S-adenosyl-L-methionine hydrolase (adenosine-forming)